MTPLSDSQAAVSSLAYENTIRKSEPLTRKTPFAKRASPPRKDLPQTTPFDCHTLWFYSPLHSTHRDFIPYEDLTVV